jgi:hypothetical protein
MHAILIEPAFGAITQIDLDISPEKNEVAKHLQGGATFIGQWPELDVVIIRSIDARELKNENRLPPPFDHIVVHGNILLVRMDENSEHQPFTLEEYRSFLRGHERVAV